MSDRELRIVLRFGREASVILACEEFRQRKIAAMRPEDFAPIARRFIS